MPPRYFEIIITGRQLAALVVGVAAAIVLAFALGVGVRWTQPREAVPVAAVVPTVVWQPTAAGEPTQLPAAEPTAAPVAAPTPSGPSPRAAGTPRTQPATPARPGRWVQVAALGTRKQADGARTRVMALGFTPRQVVVEAAEGKFRVRVGPFPDVESAGRVAARLRAEGFGGSFVVKQGD